jgi:peptide methionine sulfoxide reductase msrA/msrB
VNRLSSLIFLFFFVQTVHSEETAYFAGGCFWGIEYFFAEEPGVLKTSVGFMGGQTSAPTYHEVCAGRSGHAEAVEVIFDPQITTYEHLTKLFFEIHDPTVKQTAQYRSALFYCNQTQRDIAIHLVNQLRKKGFHLVTEVSSLVPFYRAEEYHQHYYKTRGIHPCHCQKIKRF